MGTHLVTGGSGYVGSFIIKKLIEMGENIYSLDVIDPLERIEKVKYFKGSVLDKELIDNLTRKCDFSWSHSETGGHPHVSVAAPVTAAN